MAEANDCIFCKIAKQEIDTPLVYEDEDLVAFKDLHPQAPHHFLIIPKVHVERIGDLNDDNLQLVGKMVAAAKKLAQAKGIYDEGYRLVINSGDNGGQTVYHLHMHMLGGRFMRWPPG